MARSSRAPSAPPARGNGQDEGGRWLGDRVELHQVPQRIVGADVVPLAGEAAGPVGQADAAGVLEAAGPVVGLVLGGGGGEVAPVLVRAADGAAAGAGALPEGRARAVAVAVPDPGALDVDVVGADPDVDAVAAVGGAGLVELGGRDVGEELPEDGLVLGGGFDDGEVAGDSGELAGGGVEG